MCVKCVNVYVVEYISMSVFLRLSNVLMHVSTVFLCVRCVSVLFVDIVTYF